MPVSAHKFNVITNCTSRKSAQTAAAQLYDPGHGASLDELADAWVQTLEACETAGPASTLYQGRSFSEAKAVAAQLSAELHVVSAGLGLVNGKTPVPHYSLTVSQGAGSIAQLLKKGGYCAADWWQALSRAKDAPDALNRLIMNADGRQTLIALPSSYLKMIDAELESLDDVALSRVRIFSSPAGAAALSERVRQSCLPYDDRLEGHPRYAGTKADFPQRAMRHFVESVRGHSLPLMNARKAVFKSLSALSKPTLPTRMRRSDEEIMDLLFNNWHRFNGYQAPLLRYLRDEALVSCEQSRFSGLWRQAKDKMFLA